MTTLHLNGQDRKGAVKRRVLCGGLVLTAVAVGLAVTAPSADAVRRYSQTGRPGIVGMPLMNGWFAGGGQSVIQFQPRLVFRSASYPKRRQTICVQYRLFRLDYAGPFPKWWPTWQSSWGCSVAEPGMASVARFRGLAVYADVDRAYNAEVWATWRVGSKRIGSARYSYNHANDYRCQTQNCATDYGANGVAYIMFGYFQ
jgi:hypothetical protein